MEELRIRLNNYEFNIIQDAKELSKKDTVDTGTLATIGEILLNHIK